MLLCYHTLTRIVNCSTWLKWSFDVGQSFLPIPETLIAFYLWFSTPVSIIHLHTSLCEIRAKSVNDILRKYVFLIQSHLWIFFFLPITLWEMAIITCILKSSVTFDHLQTILGGGGEIIIQIWSQKLSPNFDLL